MRGVEFAEVRDTIARVFNADEFDMFLFERLDFDRPVHVADGPFKTVVWNVLRAAEMQGWEANLIAEVAGVRPGRPDVQEMYQKYAAALVGEARRSKVDEAVRQGLEKFGLGPKANLQRAGKSETPAPASTSSAGFERTIKERLGFADAELWRNQMFKFEGRVCRVELGGKGTGTGFLVGPDVVLTNYHVMKPVMDGAVAAANVRFRFDYRKLANGLESSGPLVELFDPDPKKWLIDQSEYSAAEAAGVTPDNPPPKETELDYALVRLKRPLGQDPIDPNAAESPKRGWIELPAAPQPIAEHMAMIILQHPKSDPLKLALDTDAVLKVYDHGLRVRYATNTEEGSSGSPCFDFKWNLIALHHYGDPDYNHPANYNQGIPIGRVRTLLTARGKAAHLGGVSP
jgi:trypsin-like peptidase/effector-associated domain 1 (EAD1)-containing protein